MLIPWLSFLYLISFLGQFRTPQRTIRQLTSARSNKHRQRQNQRPNRRPEHDRRPIQRRPLPLLRLLRWFRALDKRSAQTPPPLDLHTLYHATLGHRHGLYGSRA